jgi:hypothetical protein
VALHRLLDLLQRSVAVAAVAVLETVLAVDQAVVLALSAAPAVLEPPVKVGRAAIAQALQAVAAVLPVLAAKVLVWAPVLAATESPRL